jgi:hypothetical protein
LIQFRSMSAIPRSRRFISRQRPAALQHFSQPANSFANRRLFHTRVPNHQSRP